MTIALATLVVLILVNGFFAASEIALVSLNDNKVKRMAHSGDRKAQKLYDLISKPSRFLSTIQIGITLAGFLASAFAADFFAGPMAQALYHLGVPLSQSFLETFSLIVITIILSYFTLVFGELVPKQLALHKAEAISNVAVMPLTFLFKLCLPIVKFLSFSTNTVLKLLGVDPNAQPEEATEEEIRLLVDDGGDKGTIQKAEKLMIHNIFEFNDKDVSDVITHRTDMSALPVDATLQETIRLVNSKRFTRFPVYEEDLDNIVGILHAKDLIHFLEHPNGEAFQLRDLIRKPNFVLETQRLDLLFREMQKKNIHIAIVIDEYGGTEGLVTIEDVIEEIVGDIFSEHAEQHGMEEHIEQVTQNQFTIPGTSNLFDVEEALGIHMPVEHFDTLSGFLIDQLGYFPGNDEQPVVEYRGVHFEVKNIAEKRIEHVIATINSEREAVDEQ
ncbi:HlyC/CorC family transporter [Bacillaceae bacterium SIJ1]|uniref:hemolysin family protein n=1 Tax=Litoribacterium kuwaitense TaxID=1398745 RepID=UPI0013EC371B|nr:hemolysin family protein [Litoribacterium kuwaitense]NGP43835.1 HlyC/CorC family transporter [Litoribacterium kuwaitense]